MSGAYQDGGGGCGGKDGGEQRASKVGVRQGGTVPPALEIQRARNSNQATRLRSRLSHRFRTVAWMCGQDGVGSFSVAIFVCWGPLTEWAIIFFIRDFFFSFS